MSAKSQVLILEGARDRRNPKTIPCCPRVWNQQPVAVNRLSAESSIAFQSVASERLLSRRLHNPSKVFNKNVVFLTRREKWSSQTRPVYSQENVPKGSYTAAQAYQEY